MLDSYVDFAMENAREDVAHHRSVLLNATVIDSQGKMVIIGANNLRTDKDKLGWYNLIKLKVAERQGQAVVITAPVSRAIYSEDGARKFRELQAAGIELGIDDAVELGLCEKVNAILVSLYTPLETKAYTQDYEYVNGKVVFGTKTTMATAAGASFTGRFASFFDELPKTKPS
jgi:hypothetical protein